MKFNEIVHHFQHNIFGNLTTIRSIKDKNKIWFLGAEIQEFLGFVNLTQVTKNAKLHFNEKFTLTKKQNPKFWNDFATTQHVGAKIRNITFISESGLYKLILRSNKPEAEKFANWVTSDVLPSLRQGVEEDLVMKETSITIGKHLDEQQQREESKNINRVNMVEGGKTKTVKYNIRSCVDHDDYNRTPKQVKKWAEEIGMCSLDRTSAKEVFRKTDKHIACSMSLHDNLVSKGIEYEKALMVTNGVGKELFKQLIEIGVKPKELEL